MRPIWKERPSPGYQAIKALVLGGFALVIVIPILVVISTSLASDRDIIDAGGYVLWPSHPTLKAYQTLFGGGLMGRAILVSVFVTLVGTAIALAVTIALAYATSRPVLFGRPVLLMVLFTLLFAPGIIPMFLMVKQLGLLDSLWSLILPGALGAFNFVVLRTFFMNVPGELLESARIDGASDFTILRRIVLPLSKAVVAVVGLFYAVGYWNAFFNALLYINDNTKWPLQMVLRTYIVQQQPLPTGAGGVATGVGLGLQPAPGLAIKMAIVVIAIVPVLLVYPFIQRHFQKGVIIGAVKG